MQFRGFVRNILSPDQMASRGIYHTRTRLVNPCLAMGSNPHYLSSCELWSIPSRIRNWSISQTCITNSLSPSVDIWSTCDWKCWHTYNNLIPLYSSEIIYVLNWVFTTLFTLLSDSLVPSACRTRLSISHPRSTPSTGLTASAPTTTPASSPSWCLSVSLLIKLLVYKIYCFDKVRLY